MSPCGEAIATVRVLKSLNPTDAAIYWTATALEELAANQLMLFVENPGYTTISVTGPLEPAADYIIEVNGVRGISLSPGRLRPGQGA